MTSAPVPADRIIHLFNPERPGQGRGITRLAPIIARSRDLQLYEDAELQRKNLETRFSVLVQGEPSDLAPFSVSDTRTQSEIKAAGDLGTLGSGNIIGLPPGHGTPTVVTPTAAPGYVEYVKWQLHMIAAGMGVTYEMLTGDVSEVNFSSARVRILQFRREIEQLQWLTIIPYLCRPIWRAFIDAAFLAGKIRGEIDYGCDWSTPKWDYVNPQQDVGADLDEIFGGLSSFSEKLRQRGYKPDQVFGELQQDVERLKDLGLLDVLMMLQKGRTMGQQPPPAAAAE